MRSIDLNVISLRNFIKAGSETPKSFALFKMLILS